MERERCCCAHACEYSSALHHIDHALFQYKVDDNDKGDGEYDDDDDVDVLQPCCLAACGLLTLGSCSLMALCQCDVVHVVFSLVAL